MHLPHPSSFSGARAKWAVARQAPTRIWALLLPCVAIAATLMYSSWSSKAGRLTDWSSVWQFRTSYGLHNFNRDQGLLYVNATSKARHPIADLISRAEHRWQQLNERQSKTLGEAYDEYIRRYSTRG